MKVIDLCALGGWITLKKKRYSDANSADPKTLVCLAKTIEKIGVRSNHVRRERARSGIFSQILRRRAYTSELLWKCNHAIGGKVYANFGGSKLGGN